MKSPSYSWQLLYFIVAAIHIVAILTSTHDLEFITKPLLIPILTIIFYSETRHIQSVFRNRILVALLFSWIGDEVLMFQDDNENFFIAGLFSFLLAHIFYILAFLKTPVRDSETLLRHKPWIVLIFIGYGMGFFLLIRDGLGSMMIPVIAYMCIILAMGITALNRYNRVEPRSFMLVFTGALFFMLSDSLLAVNKFYTPLAQAGIFIMLTYIAAQYFIMKGSMQQVTDTVGLTGV